MKKYRLKDGSVCSISDDSTVKIIYHRKIPDELRSNIADYICFNNSNENFKGMLYLDIDGTVSFITSLRDYDSLDILLNEYYPISNDINELCSEKASVKMVEMRRLNILCQNNVFNFFLNMAKSLNDEK